MPTPWPLYARRAVRIARSIDDVLPALRELPSLAREHGPLAGFVSYDAAHAFERLPSRATRDLELPLLWFGRAKPLPTTLAPESTRALANGSIDHASYLAAAEHCLEFIAAGDVFQINFAQRFSGPSVDPSQVFSRMHSRTPAPYAALLDLGDAAIASNSPELFFAIDAHRRVVNRPIKGTRPNQPGMADELLRSTKDAAELAMIVDLQRNDLGRICTIGSVRVNDARRIETHPTVIHGVAEIEGQLRNDVTLADVFSALFPCGSVTGCPKIRAMQIIDELEPFARGPYCGAIGVVEPDGTATFNVAIRTIVFDNNRAFVSVGGGIVADSTPQAEYEETLTKATAMFAALGWSLPEAAADDASPSAVRA